MKTLEGPATQRFEARKFADKWTSIKNEKQYSQSFWSDFFHKIIGVEDLMIAGVEFEFPVKNVMTGRTQFIDVLWSGVVIVEHKSAGISLDIAEKQARDYLVSLDPKQRPPFLILSDFKKLRIVNVLLGEDYEFLLSELPENLDRINAVFRGYHRKATINQTVADRTAAKLMGSLYTELEKAGYEGHALSVFLVRILFLLFGDDTMMWNGKPDAFKELVEDAEPDGTNLHRVIQELFDVLDTEHRPPSTPARFAVFPWVNGGLFKERLPYFYFNQQMRDALVEACHYDWSKISPAIFGAMFQTVKSKEDRHQLGEHYTSEANILKTIRPLFLDEYNSRIRKAWDDVNELKKIRTAMGTRIFLDPACGSGNFLIVAYLRLRDLEKKIIARIQEITHDQGQVGFSMLSEYGVSIKLSQFHGIEYEEWSSQIATVAMFLADRQADLALSEIIGEPINRFPLTDTAKIVNGNALEVDWAGVCPMDDNTVIMGNPPFVSGNDLSAEQKLDQQRVWGKVKGAGSLDYVASWFLLTARHISKTKAVASLIATNSITHGQQPPVLWGELYKHGIGIDFAHRPFAWWNEGGKVAGVHPVIVGFSANPKPANHTLWVYETPKSEPREVKVPNINAYLLSAPDVLITSRNKPLHSSTQPLIYGSKPADGSSLSKILAPEAETIRETDPVAAKYLKLILGADELLDGSQRYCLWLVDADPTDLATSPVLKERVSAVRAKRLKSTKAKTIADANRPTEFQEIRQPKTAYIAVPLHTSENRDYIPMGRLSPDIIASNALSVIPDGSLTTFGWLQSRPFNVWNKGISGRLESRLRISASITYNNFPFPELTEKQRGNIERASEAVLDAREQFPNSTLAHLYDRNAMPSVLRKAHERLDRATLNALGLRVNASDERVMEALFISYSNITQGFLLN